MALDLTDEDLRGLSENERAALLEAAEDDEDGDVAAAFGKAPAAAAPAPAAPGGEEAATDAEDEEAAAAAAAAAAPAAPAPAPAAPAPAPAADAGAPAAAPAADDEPAPDVPPPRATPADIEDQRKALNTREDESMQKLLDGEITPDEHAKVKAEVRKSLDDLLLAEATDKATAAVEMRQMMAEYRTDLGATMKLGKAAGLDYSEKADTGKEFNRLVRMFSTDLLEQGIEDRPGNLANSREALKQAHQMMLVRHGKAAREPAPAPAPAAAPPAARGAVDRSKLPPTLAGTPAAADATIAGNKFTHLNAITDPAELERELAKMSPADQEAYLDS